MTNMAGMAIYGKKTYTIFFSGTNRPIICKVGMQHPTFNYYQVCLNDDPGLTLTFFTAKSI